MKLTMPSAEDTDPALLKKNTSFQSYATRSGLNYPSIRTFYHEQLKANELPNDLPLLVRVSPLTPTGIDLIKTRSSCTV